MTEREMLELAAKAGGIPVGYEDGKYFYCEHGPFGASMYGRQGNTSLHWNPLNADGDCARMEATLAIDVRWGHYVYSTDGSEDQIGVICGDYHGSINAVEPYGADKQAARRLASTRVAAMMGEAMP